ncbi:MAG: SDR family NAD(P)-dependent oxidoreductase [Bdellovibrio sp.]|nr:SDR family NAD(P)-dependent oxidoreductase [Bdellovibrio sp.]
MNNPSQNLKNSYTLITGASSGIGKATALLFAHKKHALILTARRLDRLEQVKQECLAAGAADVLIFAVDVTQKTEIEAMASQLKTKNIKLKCLVNNAGLAKGTELLQNSETSDWDQMIDTNIKGLLYVTRALLPLLIEAKGQIVNMGSVAGRLVYEGGAVYCATKFAVRALSEGFRMDLKGTGVRVTNIEPGMVNTEFSLVRLGNQQKADVVYTDMMPLLANDIAETILWCVDRPAHVNIQELIIYPTDQATVGQVVRGDKSIKNLIK